MVRALYIRLGSSSRCSSYLFSFWQALVFVIGLSFGVLFSLSLFTIGKQQVNGTHKLYRVLNQAHRYKSEERRVVGNVTSHHTLNDSLQNGEAAVAVEMKKEVRVLCLVLTTHGTFNNSGRSINETWGRHCNTLLFVSNFEDSSLPVVKLYAGSGTNLEHWALIKSAMKYLFANFLSTHDWILRVDDYTFVVLENLRQLLSSYNPSDPLYFGFRLKKFVEQGFMSKDAGYVLSRGAVQKMVEEGISKDLCAEGDGGLEDQQLGECLEALNVTPVDTRDSLGRDRFFPFGLYQHLIPGGIPDDSWFWDRSYYPASTGFGCCSDTAISFHGLNHNAIMVMYYMVYHLRPYGINSRRLIKNTNYNNTKVEER